jgi:hypothetical protein
MNVFRAFFSLSFGSIVDQFLHPPSMSLCPCFKPAFLQRDWRCHQGTQHTPGHSSPNTQVWFHYQAQLVVHQACRVAPSRKVQSVAIQSLLRYGCFQSEQVSAASRLRTGAFRSQVVLSWCSGPAVQLSVVLVVMARSVHVARAVVLSQFAAVVLLVHVLAPTVRIGLVCGLCTFPPMALHKVCTRNSYSTTSAISASSYSSSIIVCFLHRRTRPLRVACFAVFRVCHGHPRPLRASARVLSS